MWGNEYLCILCFPLRRKFDLVREIHPVLHVSVYTMVGWLVDVPLWRMYLESQFIGDIICNMWMVRWRAILRHFKYVFSGLG